jgi:hypothetical protein
VVGDRGGEILYSVHLLDDIGASTVHQGTNRSGTASERVEGVKGVKDDELLGDRESAYLCPIRHSPPTGLPWSWKRGRDGGKLSGIVHIAQMPEERGEGFEEFKEFELLRYERTKILCR